MVKKIIRLGVLSSGLMFLSTTVSAQTLQVNSEKIHVDELPEYLIIMSEMATFSGGILLTIQDKGSPYKGALSKLRRMLTDKDMLNLKNQMDILNNMSVLGFEFVDAYTSSHSNISRTSMVFRKKPTYRN
ncbi:MAG: hypothetical protein AAGA43_10195 [Bacteroidota bacterium]